VFIKDKTKVTSRVSSGKWDGVEFSQMMFRTNEKKFHFRN